MKQQHFSSIVEDIYKPGDIIIPSYIIEERLKIIAKELAVKYASQKILVVGLLSGAAWVTTELFTNLHNEGLTGIELDFMKVTSYPTGTTASNEPRIVYDVSINPHGKTILIVDDIADTGKTLTVVEQLFTSKNANAVESFVLIDKPSRRTVPYQPTFVGFTLPDIWVQGRGMDTDGLGRGNPNIIKGPFVK